MPVVHEGRLAGLLAMDNVGEYLLIPGSDQKARGFERNSQPPGEARGDRVILRLLATPKKSPGVITLGSSGTRHNPEIGVRNASTTGSQILTLYRDL
jgi:hypothetical protein